MRGGGGGGVGVLTEDQEDLGRLAGPQGFQPCLRLLSDWPGSVFLLPKPPPLPKEPERTTEVRSRKKKKKIPLLSARRAWLREEPTGRCFCRGAWRGLCGGQVVRWNRSTLVTAERLKACLHPLWPFPAKNPAVHWLHLPRRRSWDSSLLSPHLNPAFQNQPSFLLYQQSPPGGPRPGPWP